ncbi:MAG: ATP-binding protein [Gemmobacter sp.]
MFRRILIANRGEIACRIVATCRRLGVETVAVHSTADAGSRHVALAARAEAIGDPAPADSYLRGDRIIAAALETGAQAIHPGYGFLSENPDFVDQVVQAGLVFIGPSAAAIRAMGLKDAAKRLMSQAGVPVVPGYHGADQSPDRLASEAAAVGYPVLIKAVAGGGGKGMRRIDAPQDFAAGLASAQAEAANAFGNPDVLVEKYIERPRHIEMQVFGDGTDAIHLYERDCSLQRRHQKVIEEAPAPGMTPGVRAAMGEAAVRAAKAIGYAGAGTVEFIVDGAGGLRPDGFWFMEMNTRLQVEHPVTEAVTGLDLVEWQLRVAAGEPLPLRQDQVPLTGHAFEARLYAEDVPAGFLPATGTLAHLAFPPGIRADTGVRAGDRISPWYDPMIAKIVTHGPTRAIALSRLARALDETEVAGTVTNLAFLGALARHPGFAAGEVDTGLIARDLDRLATPPDTGPEVVVAAAMAAADSPLPMSGFALWQPLVRTVPLDGPLGRVAPTVAFHGSDHAEVVLDGTAHAVRRQGGGWVTDGPPVRRVIRQGGTIHIFPPGPAAGALTFRLPDLLDRAPAATVADRITRSPMPGLVREVAVVPGDVVARGDRLAVIEAMKMQHVLTATRDGRVAEVLVAAGAQVEAGAALVALEAQE